MTRKKTPRVRLELTTYRLTAGRATNCAIQDFLHRFLWLSSYIVFSNYNMTLALDLHMHSSQGDWSSGMIPASGAGGRGFDSPITPFCIL